MTHSLVNSTPVRSLLVRSRLARSQPRFVAALLAALLGVAMCPSLGPAQDADRPGILVDVVLRMVSVEATKIDGSSWDPFGGKPDLRVDVQSGVRRSKSPVKKDALAHDFKARAIRVRAGDVVEFAVWDQDALADDFIGSIKASITSADIVAGGATYFAFGRVKELRIEMKR